jgi:hypothetical protein
LRKVLVVGKLSMSRIGFRGFFKKGGLRKGEEICTSHQPKRDYGVGRVTILSMYHFVDTPVRAC